MATCPGSLVLHRGGNIAGCSEDDERDGSPGLELHHEGDPQECWRVFDGCDVCGIHQAAT